MAPPSPEVPLDDACTAIYNNTLYAYSKDAFQALKIEDGAEWETLSMGVSVTNGVCVKATPGDDSNPDALYIVGGTPNSTLTDTYSGLQRYDFSKAAWESIDYEGGKDVTQNRVYHSAVYLNESALILVYAGSTDGSMSMSSQTFTVDTGSSWAVSAYESIAPPSVAPLLIPWSESEAVLVGGTDTNTKVMIFSPSNSWVDSNSTLTAPLRNSSYVKGVVVEGDDGSKTLFTFDMTVSPNSVNRTVLIDANSNPVSNSAAITARDLTLADWPSYNDTLAPTSTRSGYSIADDASGLVIGSGGNTADTLCMFETKENYWLNATAELGSASASQTVLGGGSTTNSTTTTTSASSTSTSAADDQAISRAISMKILAAVLASVLGLAALLLICLLLFRWRAKRKMFKEAGQARRASGIPVDDEKSGFNFDDKEPHSYTVPQQSRFRGHGHGHQDSVSSMAILMGRIGPGHQRGYDKENGSIASNSSSIFNQKYKNAISSPVLANTTNNIIAKPTAAAPPRPARGEKDASFVATAENPRPRGSTGPRRGSSRRSSGWNRYWSGGSAMNILGFGSKRTTISSDRSSYSESRSNIVPPLQIPQAADLHLNRVHSNSPTVSHSNFTLREPSSATLERPISDATSDGDFFDRRDEFSSGVPSSINSWPPTQLDVPWGVGRSSNAYTESNYGTEVGLPRKSEDHPPLPIQGNTLGLQVQQRTMSQYTESNYGHEAEGEENPPLPIQGHQEEEGRRSDMSWLNLGVDKETK